MTRLVFIEHRRLKRARAQRTLPIMYQLIFGTGFQFAAYHTFTPN